jgi:hypothetical protein
MVNNSTNVSKTNNHHSPKKITTHATTTHGIWNPDPGFGYTQTCGGIKLVNGNPAPPLDKDLRRNNLNENIE